MKLETQLFGFCDDFDGRGTQRCQAAFNGSVDPALGKFTSDAHCILNRVGVGRTVRNDADALHAQERGAAIFRMVEALLKISKGAA